MKISRNWLQTYFDAPLPDAAALSDALTFHAFEIDGIEKFGFTKSKYDDVLDVKVTANRGHDCLCHLGIAKELSAILNIPLKHDPLREVVVLEPKTDAVHVNIENPNLCPRFTGAYIKNMHVGPSPDWLRARVEAMGQRSINNVVDIANFVMFDIGQPLHSFDARKLSQKDGSYSLSIRAAKRGEKMLGLDDKGYALTDAMLVIADGHTDEVVSIAGVKGDKPTGIDDSTTDVFLEAANWHGATIRKTAHALKLRTDASMRFEQGISPELAAFGTRAAAKLIADIAGGEVVGFVDTYRRGQEIKPVSITLAKTNAVLGASLTASDIADVFLRLGLLFLREEETFIVTPPFERLDLQLPEDLIEEIGRIIGYDKIPAVQLPPFTGDVEVNSDFYAAEKVREELMAQGYSEVFTSVFSEKGERVIANKIDGVRPHLRATLIDGLAEALKKNMPNKDLLGLAEIKLFEIGTVWKDGKETIMVASVSEKAKAVEKPLTEYMHDVGHPMSYMNLALSGATRYEPFSKYPFIVRDIALWVPDGTNADEVLAVIREHAGDLLVQSRLFDEFAKNGRRSFAFRLVFQSFDRTLFDGDANQRMESISAAMKAKEWEVR